MTGEMLEKLIVQVISSWQVWVVTIALVIYISIVRAVASTKVRRIPPPPQSKGKGKKDKGKEKPKPEAAKPKTDELGLEEENVPVNQE